MRTFTSPVNQGPVFSSSTEHSKIIIDKSNSHGSEEPADKISPAKLVFPIEKPQEPSVATVTPVVPVSSTVRIKIIVLINIAFWSVTSWLLIKFA